MKIQGLAIIAIIIILPMSIILNSYSTNQMKTLDLQIQYDSKLKSATYDAIKAFQLNMSNSSTSDLADSKMRDIKASVNTFYNSLSNHFNMYGYGKDVLQNYVPAVVYTLYDGYYIYSAYTNNLDDEDNFDENATYKDGETIYGLKPYIYYSCRYKPSGSDFTITYSLDSYITIQGTINGTPVNKSGYLLSGVTRSGSPGNYKYYYNGVEITKETNLEQNVYEEGSSSTRGSVVKIKDDSGVDHQVGRIISYPCRKVNGVKYYADQSANSVFAVINDVKYDQGDVQISNVTTNDNAVKFYEDAFNFTDFVKDNLNALKVTDAVDSKGKKYTDLGEDNPYFNYGYIFGELNSSDKSIEDEDSNFNGHRLQVIKNSIESNLMVAIANYNKVSTSEVNFQMPKLEDTEWEQITQNVSMITFLQGLNIGGKIYNGHALISNNINEDFVSEDSIYISDGSEYHRVTEENLFNNLDFNNAKGMFNVDFERKTGQAIYRIDSENQISKTIYYYPRNEYASYTSVVDANSATSGKNVNEYVKELAKKGATTKEYKLAQLYYNALGRERYGMYRVTNKLEEIQEILSK